MTCRCGRNWNESSICCFWTSCWIHIASADCRHILCKLWKYSKNGWRFSSHFSISVDWYVRSNANIIVQLTTWDIRYEKWRITDPRMAHDNSTHSKRWEANGEEEKKMTQAVFMLRLSAHLRQFWCQSTWI